jgi:hypothetical protein
MIIHTVIAKTFIGLSAASSTGHRRSRLIDVSPGSKQYHPGSIRYLQLLNTIIP